MISMDMTAWAQAVRKHLEDQKNLIPEAASRAAGQLAATAVKDIRAQMGVVFKAPSDWTLRSVTHVEQSTKSKSLQHLVPADGSAAVIFKETQRNAKQIGAGWYLYPQVFGGTRRQTRMEKRLQGVSPSGQRIFMIPTKYAQYDALGNLVPGWVVAVLSALQAMSGAGFSGNRRIGRNLQKSAATYGDRTFFVVWPGQSQRRIPGGGLLPNHLPPAIYQRFGEGRGAYIRPIFTFARSTPVYKVRLDLGRIVRRTVDEHAAEFFLRALKRQLPAPPPSGT